MTRYVEISRLLYKINSSNNKEHRQQLTDKLKKISTLAGGDALVTLNIDKSTPEKLYLNLTLYHHNINREFLEQTTHKITVKPSLAFGYHIKVTPSKSLKKYDAEHDIYNIVEVYLENEVN